MVLTYDCTYLGWRGKVNRRPPNTSSINTVASKRVRNSVSASEFTSNLYVCFIQHTNLQRARGEEKLSWLHLARALIQPVQIQVSVTPGSRAVHVCPGWSSPAQEQQETVLYYRLLMSCCLHRPLGSDLSLPLTWQEWGSQHQHLQRDGMGEPGDRTWGWTGHAGWPTGQETLNQSAPKSLQLRLPHFITDTHTHSFPFTWVLLMDLGLGSADNINGSRLTEVPLQWTVCLCVYMHTHFFFLIQFQANSQNL